jgi:hypothetical protein
MQFLAKTKVEPNGFSVSILLAKAAPHNGREHVHDSYMDWSAEDKVLKSTEERMLLRKESPETR